ncbi:hypothetical protein CKO23_17845 [Thiocystis violacea]|nr:hypothetical protein [Thiocystis violacea]
MNMSLRLSWKRGSPHRMRTSGEAQAWLSFLLAVRVAVKQQTSRATRFAAPRAGIGAGGSRRGRRRLAGFDGDPAAQPRPIRRLARHQLLRGLITVHPLGDYTMGEDIETGVVDHRRQVFGYPNLYVADGAILARPTGRNPSMTIGALAERVADLMVSGQAG